jgi:UDP-N-acetylmuramoylalanine--D-glutamate ligase
MDSAKNFFKGKKVTVMGLGLLGRGVGDAAYIAEAGAAEVLVTDLKAEADLVESFNRLKGFPNVVWRLGEHQEEDFRNRDLIVVAAGVPDNSPYLATAQAAGVPLAQSAALFAQLSGIPIIGVTGTRGKSTVTHMIHHVLSVVTGEHIILGGNIRGVSNLQLLHEVTEDSLAVMELDSWQLQGFGWAEVSPHIAVFTNFMEDHLNYYMTDSRSKEEAMDAYFKDKANIFAYQEESGVFVTTPAVFEHAKRIPRVTLGQEVVLVDDSIIPEDALLSMPGEHNRLNAALAVAALRATGLTDEEIFEGLATFTGVPGRLQYLGLKAGVKIYNDNNATTPQATIAGLTALGTPSGRNIILIAGGAYKNIDPAPLIPVLEQYCKELFLLPGTGTEQLVEQLSQQNLSFEWKVLETLPEAVEEARLVAEAGDIILFSPGFASFGMFKNEYDRNDQFVQLIDELVE